MGLKVLSDRGLLGLYYAAMESGDVSWFNVLAAEIDSNQDKETHVWLGMPPQMREWLGGKQAKGFNDFAYAITNKDFESTIEYHERDLAEDKTGQLQIRINGHSERVLSHPAKLLTTLIQNGASGVCYDGQYYFDTDHSEGSSGSQSNSITTDVTAPTAPTAGEMEGAILSSVQQMFGFKDDQGEPLNENAKEFMVMVPVPFFKAALTAIGGGIIVDGSVSRTNMIVNQKEFDIRLKVNPRLTWTDKFATFRTDAAVKPFIDQVREKTVVSVLGEGSDSYFQTRRKQVSLTKAGNVGYGLWQGAVLNTLN